MKTREAALFEFLDSFSIPAYPATATTEKTELPYITYNIVVGSWDMPVSMEVDIWMRTESEAAINGKVREIERVLSGGGKVITYDGGAIWITKGSPWAQAVPDEDNTIKRRYLNFDLQYEEL